MDQRIKPIYLTQKLLITKLNLMKRSNFTFLFLFALLSFVSVNLGAQATSSSCINEVNISVDADCGFVVDAAVLGATGPAAMAQSIVYAGTGSGTPFPGTGSLTGATGLGLPDGGSVQYQLFSGADGTGPMLCWGTINFEIKLTPDPVFTYQEVMCSQPLPGLPKVSDVAAAANGECSAEITNITESRSVSGDACTGFVTIRNITGTADIDGGKSIVLLRSDTIVETPLDTSMVECPLGGPTWDDRLTVFCEDIDGAYPSPDVIFSYYYAVFRRAGYSHAAAENLAIQRAYPYVPKGIVQDSVIDEITETIDTTFRDTLIMIDGIWVATQIAIKTSTFDTTYIDTDYPLALPLPKGVTCNLSVKCTDMQFPGCAGDSSKVMRSWQVLDWCNGSVKEHMQWIEVKSVAPVFLTVLGKKVTLNSNGTRDFTNMWPGYRVPVQIAPWTCAAQIALSATTYLGCAPSGTISWSSTAGVIGSDNVLRSLWLNEEAEVTATAIDDCGQISTFTFTVVPVNTIYPVPVAEDQVNVSLTGDPTGTVSPDGGVAKVFVDAIDAGSHNAGCGEVETCVLLKEELENPVVLGGVHVSVNGNLIYHASGCRADGVLPEIPPTKLNPGRPAIPYVICKDFVKFCCEDIGDNLVALVATNSGGRSAHSWSTVTVEDKSQSQYSCHPDVLLECGDGYNPYWYAPAFRNAVCTPSTLEYTRIENVDACGDGYHLLIWSLDGVVICETLVYFDGESAFNPYEIKWPKHFTGEYEGGVIRECELWVDGDGDPVLDKDGNEQYRINEYLGSVAMGPAFDCEEGGNTGEPVWCEAACALVGSSFEPLEVEAADACKKIIRRWTVIDWCTWDPNTDNQDDENDSATDSFQAVDDEWLDAYAPAYAGQWYTDYTERYDPAVPNYELRADGVVVPTGGYVTKLDCDWCDKQNASMGPVYFRYTSVDKDGYYTYDQVIKVLDETAPTIDAPEEYTVSVTGGATSKGDDFDGCYSSEDISASVTDMCGDTDIASDDAAWWIEVYVSDENGSRVALAATATKFGSEVTMNSQAGVPGSYHLIVWSVRDGCGNVGYAETLVYFQDDKKPTPVCIQDLSTAIMPSTGTVEIWASDYDNGSFDNCSEVSLWFFVDDDGFPANPDTDAGNFVANLNVTCDMLAAVGQGETLILALFAFDAAGNYDFCNITLNVNGAAEVCDLNSTAAAIQGHVFNRSNDMIESAEIALNVGSKDVTDVQGSYAFNGNPLFQSYEVRAEKLDNPLNGVSTLDLVLIQKHILGLQTLESSYDIIAGDINGDARLTATDLVDLRMLILGVVEDFPNNDSWRFVDAGQQFADPSNPFPFNEIINISNLSGNQLDEDFIGVKIGDVNGNAIANSLIAESRSAVGTLSFELEDVSMSEGDVIEVPVLASNFAAISAYQFTMELNGIAFEGAYSGALEVSESNFGLIDANTVTTAWYTSEEVSSEEVLFTMTFRATSDVNLSEALRLSSRVTESVAYTGIDRLNVGLTYNTVGSAGFALLQNTPNPFDEVTQIGFELPEAGQATLTVFDVTGKTVSVMTEDYNAGYNQITLRKSDLGTSGVLYYQLESGNYTATRKMILID